MSKFDSKKKLKNYSTEKPCLVCGIVTENGNDLHHIISRGARGPDEDWNLMPLCNPHHQEIHSGRTTFAGKYSQARDFLLNHGWEYFELNHKWNHSIENQGNLT